LFGWGVPSHPAIKKETWTPMGNFSYYKDFVSAEDAEEAVNVVKLSHKLKEQVIKEL
jgi:hypothetical protein